MGERSVRNAEVGGSSPPVSTNNLNATGGLAATLR